MGLVVGGVVGDDLLSLQDKTEHDVQRDSLLTAAAL